jgi:EAL domain-containing protein (putative c-di-GMP-specific phosphodiesterase class I)/ActR/RegA family two-component response regulator
MPRDIDGASTPALLVADDDRTQRAIIGAAAARLGFRVVHAASVDAADDHLGSEHFDTVVVDLALGERDGIELLRSISQLRPIPRVIVASGCEERILNAAVRFAHAAGITGAVAVPKPIDVARLSALLGSKVSPRSAGEPTATLPPMTAAAIARGLDNDEFFPVFQPKIDLASGRVAGCEALARWRDPKLGTVDPADFVAVAEATGQVREITRSILSRSIACAREFTKRAPDFVLAVNVSAALLTDLSLPDEVDRMLADSGVSPRSLLLEITESIAMSDIARATDVLVRLRIKGVGVAIDDFGTGYSSLSALARMPFSELKIDQSFVRHCLTDGDLMKIVRGSIALGHEFRMKVVAEGIEDEATRQALASAGCDLGQGFLFSAPLPRDGFLAWMGDRAARDRGRGLGAT